MNIKPVKTNDRESWLRAVYDALDEIDDANWQIDGDSSTTQEEREESESRNRDDVMFAMALIAEELGVDIKNL